MLKKKLIKEILNYKYILYIYLKKYISLKKEKKNFF